ncbi:MAG: hypothetical protein OEV76_03320 [Anaerolineae bacterium]|nr:hypothetical protein [Anaerolineae bacterium]
MIYHPFVTRVVSGLVMRRERMLPLRGEVLVSTGDRVRPADVVARTQVPGEMCLLNVARALRLSDGDLSPYLRVAVGDAVERGDVLAAGRGASLLWGRTYRSPVSGVVGGVCQGRVLIQSDRRSLELVAHYRGTVINVMSGLGAIFEVRGALIQGVWGSDKAGFGVVKCMVENPAEELVPQAIDLSCRGGILVAGRCLDEMTLQRAAEADVQGLVLGSLEARLLDAVQAMPFPVVVTEGMGDYPLSGPLFDLLKAYEGQEASVKGLTESRGGALRPEVIIYTSVARERPVLEARPEFVLEVGSQVRIVRGPHLGKTGVVSHLPQPEGAPLGAERGRGIKVRLARGEAVPVAQPNLELFG